MRNKYNLYPPNLFTKLALKRRYYLENDIPPEKWPIFLIRKKDFDRELNDSKHCLATKDFKMGKLHCVGFEIETYGS